MASKLSRSMGGSFIHSDELQLLALHKASAVQAVGFIGALTVRTRSWGVLRYTVTRTRRGYHYWFFRSPLKPQT